METDWEMSGNQSLPTKYYLLSLQGLIRKKEMSDAPTPKELSVEVRQHHPPLTLCRS